MSRWAETKCENWNFSLLTPSGRRENGAHHRRRAVKPRYADRSLLHASGAEACPAAEEKEVFQTGAATFSSSRLMGTDVRFVDTDSFEEINAMMDEIGRKTGEPYYTIPVGGSVPLGALGYVDCVHEMSVQAAERGVHIDRIVCATGSGGTHAGLALGAMLYMPGTKVTGMAVDTQEFDRIVPGIMRGTAELLGLEAKTDCEVDLRPAYGPGYALPSDEGSEAIRLMARCEGIFLDPVYTGKAFAGLIEMVRSGSLEQEENILFLFTGGAGGLFAIDFD